MRTGDVAGPPNWQLLIWGAGGGCRLRNEISLHQNFPHRMTSPETREDLSRESFGQLIKLSHLLLKTMLRIG